MAMNFGNFNEGGSGWTSVFAGGQSQASAPSAIDAGAATKSTESAAGASTSGIMGGIGALGSVFSGIGTGGKSAGTGGSFTQMGASTGNPYALAAGVALDIGMSHKMQKKADAKAEKEASNFLQVGLANMANLKEEGEVQKGAVRASLGATGAELTSGTSMAVQAKTNRIVDFNYNMAYQNMLAEYKQIKNSSDASAGGGMMGAF